MKTFDKVLLSIIAALLVILSVGIIMGKQGSVSSTIQSLQSTSTTKQESTLLGSLSSTPNQVPAVKDEQPVQSQEYVANGNLSPSNQTSYPAFITNLMQTMQTGEIATFSYDGEAFYSVLSSFAPGTGPIIYNSNGVNVATCPVMPNRPQICDSLSNRVVIWEQH